MGKKYNPRATLARRQQALAEKQRKQAERRTAWWQAHGRQVILGCAALAAAVALAFIIPAIVKENGLPKKIGNLSKIEENWLVIDADATTKVRYHHPASFDAPQGYTRSAFTNYDDGVTQSFYYVADDAAAPVAVINVDAVAETTAEAFIQRSLEYLPQSLNEGETAVPGEAFTATVAGKEARCLYIAYNAEAGNYGVIFCAFDAPNDVCVYALICGTATAAEAQTSQELLLEAETLLAGLTIVD